MSEIREHTVKGREAGSRIDKLLSEVGLVHSRSHGQQLIDRGLVTVNGATVNKRHSVRAGEYVRVVLPPPIESSLAPESIPLDIRFEDEHLIVLSKSIDMVVHPTDTHRSGTLVHALLAHSDELGSMGGVERPGIVHRLDKDTSGLMLVAKDDETQAALADAIRIRAVDRRYVALVHGLITPDSGIIDAPIGRHPKHRHRMAVSHAPDARQAVTNFTVLARYESDYSTDDGFTLIECKLHTGRTHQIRVHMSHIDHNIVGDQLYGRRSRTGDRGLSRQFLHSYILRLKHPVTEAELRFTDTIPEDLASVLAELEEREPTFTAKGMEARDIIL